MYKGITEKSGLLKKGGLIALMVATAATVVVATPKPTNYLNDVIVLPAKAAEVEQEPALDANDRRQIQCLAENAYFEAGNQSRKGMIAVTNVVMNRVEDGRFPKTPCGVVRQKARGVCQFSWVCERGRVIRDSELFRRTREIAEDVYLDNVGDVTNGAKFYHADYVRPRWANIFRRTVIIGDHIFYRG